MIARCGCLLLLSVLGQPLLGQRVVIKNATPTIVSQSAEAYLRPDGFKVIRSDSAEVVLALDRGKIPQQGMYQGGRGGTNLFWVVMEVHVQFKRKADGLEVSAYEDVVVLHDDSSLVSRRRVNSHAELDNLRQFVTDLQRDIEGRKPEE